MARIGRRGTVKRWAAVTVLALGGTTQVSGLVDGLLVLGATHPGRASPRAA